MKLEEVQAIFEVASVAALSFHKINNEYHDDPESPWWLVVVPWGNIVIGWRKRVISISWAGINYRNDQLVTDDVTKGPDYIHAWNKIKAAEYLSVLFRAIDEESIHKPKQAHTRTIVIDIGHGREVPGFIINRALSKENIMKLINIEIDKEPSCGPVG